MDKEKNIQANISLFNRWAKSYDWGLFQFWMRRFYRPVIRMLHTKKNIKILDVGCGTGQFLSELTHTNTTSKLYGLDISDEMIKEARVKVPGAILSTGDVHDIKYQSNYFDYVICTEAFHHYYDQPKALQEMKRVVKKNGKVIVVDIDFFLSVIHWIFRNVEPGCVKINSKRELKQLFEQAGLRDVQQERSSWFAVITIGIKL